MPPIIDRPLRTPLGCTRPPSAAWNTPLPVRWRPRLRRGPPQRFRPGWPSPFLYLPVADLVERAIPHLLALAGCRVLHPLHLRLPLKVTQVGIFRNERDTSPASESRDSMRSRRAKQAPMNVVVTRTRTRACPVNQGVRIFEPGASLGVPGRRRNPPGFQCRHGAASDVIWPKRRAP
jgi:hypothetical protein